MRAVASAARDSIAVGGFTAVLAIVFLVFPLDAVTAVGLLGGYFVIVGVYFVIGGFSLKWAAAPRIRGIRNGAALVTQSHGEFKPSRRRTCCGPPSTSAARRSPRSSWAWWSWSVREPILALIGAGVAFIVVLVVLALLSMAIKPNAEETAELHEGDEPGDQPSGPARAPERTRLRARRRAATRGLCRRRQREQALLRGIPDIEPLDERRQVGGVDALAARELLQEPIGICDGRPAGDDFGADDGLDRLAEHLPVGVEVLEEAGAVEVDLEKAALDVVEHEEGVCNATCDLALGARDGEVSLRVA